MNSAPTQRVALSEGLNFNNLFAERGNPRITLISESGLYKLIMRSDKPEAKEFQDWVTKTVLPANRKDGVDIMGGEKVATGKMSEDSKPEHPACGKCVW